MSESTAYQRASDRVEAGQRDAEGRLDWPTIEAMTATIEQVKEGASVELRGEAFDDCLRLLRYGKVNDGNAGKTRRYLSKAFLPFVRDWNAEEELA